MQASVSVLPVHGVSAPRNERVEANVDSVYDDKTPLADAMRTYKWSFLVRNAKTVDLYGGSQFYEPMANKLRTGRSVQIALKAEFHVLLQLLHALRLTDNPIHNLNEAVQKILLSWTGFEIARNTARNLGFLSNTLYFIDESTMPVTQPGIARYYASLGCRDPDITARFAVTFFTEILRISRIFYDMRFDETEVVALFELYLLKLVRQLPEFDPIRLAQLTNHVCFGLKEHCSNSYTDFPARMGSVVTALGEIDSLHNLSQQVNILLQLHGVEQVPQRLD
ncbi:hypothetical protein AAVH_40902 [Aphelenchoides avenae]|nr:hypothetical protein AAVH_40902 [Aphelenchus avenae]